jgi:hypothetical protein
VRSATDIVSISTGRETILIGPVSAFGAHAFELILRDRYSIRQTLEIFVSRPNAEELLRPHLRRWGIDPLSLRVSNRHTLLEALARAAANGAIGIAKVPDVTLSFAGASLDEGFRQATLTSPARGPHLPPDLSDRMLLVFEMVPEHMEGETRQAFEQAIESLGIGVVVGGVVSWIGAHFIPGVNLAVLAFDAFALSAAVLQTLEKAHQIVTDVQNAKVSEDLKPAAIAMAAVLAALIAEGVLGRLLRAKSLTKGVGKQGGASKGKPSLPKKGTPGKTAKGGRKEPDLEPVKAAKKSGSGFLPKKMGQREDGAAAMTPELKKEINGAAAARAKGAMNKEGWPTLPASARGTFNGDPTPVDLKPGTKLYRVVDADSNPNGSFWSLTPPPRSEAQWRSGAAVQNDWNGDGAFVEHTVGKDGLKGWQGAARAQKSSDGVSALAGGADQFVTPPNSLKDPLTPQPTPWNQ